MITEAGRLAAELALLGEQRKELRDVMQQIATVKIRRGGNRGRRKISDRRLKPETEWHQPPAGVPQSVLDETRRIIAELRRNPGNPDLESSFRPTEVSRAEKVGCGSAGREAEVTGFTSETREL